MLLLNRYLIKQFATNFITVATAFIAIYLLVDFFEKIDTFTSHGGTMTMALKFFFLNIPFILDQLGPILILLAGIITLGILNHNNELRALKAGGIPLRKIVKPIVIGSLLATFFFLFLGQWILPKTIATTNKIWHEQLQGKMVLGTKRGNRFYYKGEEGFYSFQWPDPTKIQFKDFSYSRWDEDYRLKLLLSAEGAHWSEGKWHFSNGQIQSLQMDSSYVYEVFKEHMEELPESPDHFFIPEYKSEELSLSELFLKTRLSKSKEERYSSLVNFLKRISYIFLGVPLLLLGLPILIISYNTWGRDLAIAIPASCGLAFVAWGFWGTLQSLAKAGYLAPGIAAITIHMIFAGVGVILLLNQDR